MDTGALFEKYTIDEIRDIEKRTRYKVSNLLHLLSLSIIEA